MEGLGVRLWILALLLLGGAFLFAVQRPNRVHADRSEKWLESQAPAMVSGVRFESSSTNPSQSFEMDAKTYELLQPYGIVSRVYHLDGQSFEVVLIASRSKQSFHDPRVCFSGQGWELEGQTIARIPTKTRGEVQVTMAKLDGPAAQNRLAAYTYKGPSGFSATTIGLQKQLFLEQIKGNADPEGVFYRFIALNDDADVATFREFIGNYLDEAKQSSNGFF